MHAILLYEPRSITVDGVLPACDAQKCCPLKISELDGTPQVKHLDPHESTIRQGSNLQWMERSSLGGQ
ncbi:hypothetical protein C6A85_09225, partial [Mycobacterium sp. ITM-2017-0098]